MGFLEGIIFVTLSVSLQGEETSSPISPSYKQTKGKEGYWRLVHDQEGVWWFQSPEGKLEFMNMVSGVQPVQFAKDPTGEIFISKDFNGAILPYFIPQDYTETRRWAALTAKRVKDYAFKGIGAWSHLFLHERDLPMTRDLNVWRSFIDTPIFSRGWKQMAEAVIRAQVIPLSRNKNLIGYYTDNEMIWESYDMGPEAYFGYSGDFDNPNRRQVVAVMKKLWPSIEDLNKAWGLQFTSWDELEGSEAKRGLMAIPAKGFPEARKKLTSAWLYHLSRYYFRITSKLIRKYDPNHLILGVRHRQSAVPEVVQGSKEFTDAQSLNYYVNTGRLNRELFEMMYRESGGQPLIISEYSFYASDTKDKKRNESGNKNLFGFSGGAVNSQLSRAKGYRFMTESLAKVPYVVGAEWFQWNDEPPTGRELDGEDVNFGIVSVKDEPYPLLVKSIEETTPLLNPTHEKSPQLQKDDFWTKKIEVAQISLEVDPENMKVDGKLDDWSGENDLTLYTQSLSFRKEKSEPKAKVAWSKEGIFISVEDYDSEVMSEENWWEGDTIEFWISTRPCKINNVFNEFSHQFFFAPPKDRDSKGTIGQWHRDGDALKESLIPHPEVDFAFKRIEEYSVLEIFIPAKALNGFDPERHPEISFNLAIRDTEDVLEFQWAGTKEILTQFDPSTWGLIKFAALDKEKARAAASVPAVAPASTSVSPPAIRDASLSAISN